MALGTRGGNLLLKDARLQTGCACCGEQACGCGLASDVVPSSLLLAFDVEGFAPIPNDIFLIPGEAEGQEGGLSSFIGGLGEIVLPRYAQLLDLSAGFTYGTLGCSTLAIGDGMIGSSQFRDVGCSSCPPDFYANQPFNPAPVGGEIESSPAIRCDLTCAGVIARRSAFDTKIQLPSERWSLWRPLIATGNLNNPTWQASACGNQEWHITVGFPSTSFITSPSPLQVTPLCDGWTSPVTFDIYLLATARARVTDNSLARYEANGTATLTPNYANPLP